MQQHLAHASRHSHVYSCCRRPKAGQPVKTNQVSQTLGIVVCTRTRSILLTATTSCCTPRARSSSRCSLVCPRSKPGEDGGQATWGIAQSKAATRPKQANPLSCPNLSQTRPAWRPPPARLQLPTCMHGATLALKAPPVCTRSLAFLAAPTLAAPPLATPPLATPTL